MANRQFQYLTILCFVSFDAHDCRLTPTRDLKQLQFSVALTTVANATMFSIIAAAMAALLVAAPIRAAPLEHSSLQPRAIECGYDNFGLHEPANNSVITQHNDGNCTTFEVLYCSAQYFKTRSLSVDVLLSGSGPETFSNQILVKDATPNNPDSGYYGYLLNATICPFNGDYLTGNYVVTIFEAATGEFMPASTSF